MPKWFSTFFSQRIRIRRNRFIQLCVRFTFDRDSVALAPDGSFRIDDVPPGDYRLIVQVNEKTTRDPGPFAPLSRLVSVAPNPKDRPIDLGLQRLRRRSTLQPGNPAPKVEITTVDGMPLSIPDDFRNRYLLLDFGAPYSDQSRLQVLRLNALTEKLGPHANTAKRSKRC